MVFTTDEENLEELEAQDPVMVAEMTMKRSVSYKDPSKSINMETASTWHQVNQQPTKQLDKVIRPKII